MARKRLIEFDDLNPGDLITVFTVEPRAVKRGTFVDFIKLDRYYLRLALPGGGVRCCVRTARIDGIQRHRRAKSAAAGKGEQA